MRCTPTARLSWRAPSGRIWCLFENTFVCVIGWASACTRWRAHQHVPLNSRLNSSVDSIFFMIIFLHHFYCAQVFNGFLLFSLLSRPPPSLLSRTHTRFRCLYRQHARTHTTHSIVLVPVSAITVLPRPNNVAFIALRFSSRCKIMKNKIKIHEKIVK